MKIANIILKIAGGCSLMALLTGCSSMMCGTHQTIPLTASPPNTAVTVYNEFNDVLFEGTTPCTIALRRANSDGGAGYYKLVFRKDGYTPSEVILTGHKNLAYYGNIPCGVVGMMTVDPISGAMWTLTPLEVDAKLAIKEEALEKSDTSKPAGTQPAVASSIR